MAKQNIHEELHGRRLLWVVLLFLILVAPFVGLPLDPQPDERRYSIAAAHMMATGDFLAPVSETGELRLTKPPLTYYYVVAGFGLLGQTLVGAKLFFLVSAAAIVALVYALARALGSSVFTALLAAAMMAGHGLFFTTATQYIPDTPLILGTSCALLGFVHVLKGTARPYHLYLAWLGIAWAVLAKGFLPLILVAIYLVVRKLSKTPRLVRNMSRHEIAAASLALLVAAPWFVIVAVSHWDALIAQFVGDQVTSKVSATPASVLAGIGKTSAGLFLYAIPGLLALWFARRRSGAVDGTQALRNSAVYLLLGWIIVNLVVFAVSRQVFERYTLPAAPALMALAGAYATLLPMDALARAMRWVARILLPLVGAILLLGAGIGFRFGEIGWSLAGVVVGLMGILLPWRTASAYPLQTGLAAIVLFFPGLELAKLPVAHALIFPTDGQSAAARILQSDSSDQVLVVHRHAQLVDRIGVELGDFRRLGFSPTMPDTLEAEIVIYSDAALSPALIDAGYSVEASAVFGDFPNDPGDLLRLLALRDAQNVRREFGSALFFATRP